MHRAPILLTSIVLAGAAVSAAYAAPVLTARFVGGPPQIVQLKGAKAVAYDDQGTPLFRGDAASLFKAAENPDRRAFVWAIQANRVRISEEGKPGVWLACAEVQAMSIACSTTLRVSDEGVLTIAADSRRGVDFPGPTSPSAARIPDCPGDPRCP